MEIPKKETRVKVVVATTVMLSFISFWRAAAIVLNDLASSAFYVGGIAEQAIGKSAPWFILGVMLFSTVMLSFISFWRGAAMVLSDLASSAFYVGGIAEQAIGKSAPWFILGVMLFSFAVRSVYMESCSMYVRGGVYVVVRDAMGPFMARLSVSALIFDYILTGPISSVSAGQYLAGLLNKINEKLHVGFHLNPAQVAMLFGLAV